jgi:uncharacterized membrane protein YqjE
MAVSLLALVENRVQLFAVELQLERLRFLETVLKFALAVSLAMVGLLLGTLTLALYVWQVARYAGLVVMTLLFLGAGAFLLWRLKESLRQSPTPFEQTLNQLKKDREWFTTKK